MAGHNATFNRFSLEKGLYDIYAFVLSAGSGAPTLQQYNPLSNTYSAAPSGGWKGIVSVTRTGTGAWNFILDAPWVRVIQVNPCPIVTTVLLTAAAPVAVINTTTTNVRKTSSPNIAIQWQSSGGSTADPASGELLSLAFVLQNSTAC